MSSSRPAAKKKHSSSSTFTAGELWIVEYLIIWRMHRVALNERCRGCCFSFTHRYLLERLCSLLHTSVGKKVNHFLGEWIAINMCSMLYFGNMVLRPYSRLPIFHVTIAQVLHKIEVIARILSGGRKPGRHQFTQHSELIKCMMLSETQRIRKNRKYSRCSIECWRWNNLCANHYQAAYEATSSHTLTRERARVWILSHNHHKVSWRSTFSCVCSERHRFHIARWLKMWNYSWKCSASRWMCMMGNSTWCLE